jgi:hypothetical protein
MGASKIFGFMQELQVCLLAFMFLLYRYIDVIVFGCFCLVAWSFSMLYSRMFQLKLNFE